MIFGVDLGTRRVAIASVDGSFLFSRHLDNAAGRREFPLEVDAGMRLGKLARDALSQAGYQAGLAFGYERPVTGAGPKRNIRTAVGQGISAGALLSRLPGDLLEVSNTQWKKWLCGNGHAPKDEVRRWLEARRPQVAEACGPDGDLVDAVAIAQYVGHVLAPSGQL